MMIRTETDMPILVDTTQVPWVPSPAQGIERKMLERDGGEVARATSIVRYAAGCRFPAHTHDLGEEYLVLCGVFSDEYGDYPPGTYVRNPWKSVHQPFSQQGCEIFVKLRQLPDGEQRLVVSTHAMDSGASSQVLFDGGRERVAIVSLNEGDTVDHPDGEGLETLVLQGILGANGTHWPARTWIRLPAGSNTTLTARSKTTLWTKLSR